MRKAVFADSELEALDVLRTAAASAVRQEVLTYMERAPLYISNPSLLEVCQFLREEACIRGLVVAGRLIREQLSLFQRLDDRCGAWAIVDAATFIADSVPGRWPFMNFDDCRRYIWFARCESAKLEFLNQ